MGISTAAHLPLITSTSYPALTSHLAVTYNARKIGQWSVSIRVFRSVTTTMANVEGEGQASTTTPTTTKARLMYVVQMNEFPEDTFVLVEDPHRETRAGIKARHEFDVMQRLAAQAVASQAGMTIGEEGNVLTANVEDIPKQPDGQSTDNGDGASGAAAVPPKIEASAHDQNTAMDLDPVVTDSKSVRSSFKVVPATRLTLFAASSHFPMLLQRLNLPTPLGAPSSGDGATSNGAAAGPGAWLPRGQPITIIGTVYDLPSAMAYGDQGAEWRVRLGMIQAGGGGGSRNAGAVFETEHLALTSPSQHDDPFLTKYALNLFPILIAAPPTNATLNVAAGVSAASAGHGLMHTMQPSIANPVPTAEQWHEVIPASNKAWMQAVGISADGLTTNPTNMVSSHVDDPNGWRGKERGRRLAYLYITLLRNQAVI
jgi:hypothetical protein